MRSSAITITGTTRTVQREGQGPDRSPGARSKRRAFRSTKTTPTASSRTAVRSGWPVSAINWLICRRGTSGPVRRIGVDDLGATLAKVIDDAPVILLAHEPDVAKRVPARVALQLSGHTHGGQVRLLGWSPMVAVRTAAGLWPYPHQLRRRRLRRPRLQHHAVPPRRPAGDRAGDAGRAGACNLVSCYVLARV